MSKRTSHRVKLTQRPEPLNRPYIKNVLVGFTILLLGFSAVSVTVSLLLRPAAAATCTWTNTNANNSWNDAGNWSGCSSHVPGTGAGVGDAVILNNTSTANVNVDVSVSLGSFSMQGGGTSYTGTVTVQNSFTATSFTQAAGTFNSGSQTIDINGAFAVSAGGFTASSGTTSVSAAFTMSGTGTFTHNSGTLTFDGSGLGGTATLTCNSVTFNLVTLAQGASAQKTVGSSCTLPLGSNPSISSGGPTVLNGTLSGSGTLSSPSALLTIGATGVLSGFSGLTPASLTVSGATLDLSSYSPVTISSNFSLSSGTFTAPSGTMSIGAGLTISGGTFTHNSGTVNFNGTANGTLSCNSVTFNSVTFTHTSNTKTVNSNCTLPLGSGPSVGSSSGNLTLAGTLSGSGTIAFANDFTLNSTGVLSGFGGLSTGGAFAQSGGTQSFSSYNPFDVNGAFSLSSSASFTAPSGTMTVAAGFTINSGTTFTHNSGTLTFDGTGNGTLACNSTTFNLVTFAHTGGTKTVNSDCSLPLGSSPTTGTGGSFSVGGTLSGSGTLSIGGSGTSSDFTTSTGSALSGFSGLIVYGDFSQTGGTLNFGSFNPFTVNDSYSITSAASTAIFTAPSATMTVKHDFTINAGTTFTHNSGTLNFDVVSSDATLSCNSTTFNLVTLTATSQTKTISSNCSFPLGSNPTTGTGGKITLNGTLSGSGTLTSGASGTASDFSLESTGVLSGFGGFAVNGNFTQKGGTQSFSTYNPLDFNNNFTLSSAANFTAPSGTMTVATNFTLNSGTTFTHNSGTLTFDSGNGGSLSCNSTTFNLVTFNHDATKTVGSDCTLPLGNNPSTGSASATLASITLSGTLSGTGTLTSGTNASCLSCDLTLQSSAALSGFSGLAVNGSYSQSGGTINLGSYSPVDINHSFTLDTSGTFTAPSGTMTVARNFTISSATFTHNSGTLTFDGSGGGTLSCGSQTFNLVTFNHTNSKTAGSGCTLPLGNNPFVGNSGGGASLTLSGGTLSGTGTVTFRGGDATHGLVYTSGSFSGFSALASTGSLTAQSTASLNLSTYFTSVDIDFDLNILNTATLTAPSSMTIGENISRDSGTTFTHNNGSIILDGVNQTISTPATTFYTLSKTESTNNATDSILTMPVSTTITIANSLTLDGLDSTDRINIVSSSPGTASGLEFSGSSTFTGDYLDVSDSTVTDNSSGVTVPLNPANSIKGSGTTNWFGPTETQSAYRWFANDDSTDVGSALAAQDTPATAPTQGTPFRLRLLLHVDNDTLGANAVDFDLQVAERSGTCDTGFSGESYGAVNTVTGDIRFADNPTPTDGDAATLNAADPTHGADEIVYQTYEEENSFTTSQSQVDSSQDGLWDFALVDYSAAPSVSYCFRVVDKTGGLLSSYGVIPEIATNDGILTVDIVDGSGVSVPSPSVALSAGTVQFNCQNTTGTFGVSTQKIRVTNTTANPSWSLSVEPSGGPTDAWTDAGNAFDFNDPTASGCSDNGDADTYGGQMSLDPSGQSITAGSGCTTTGLTGGSADAFNEGVTDSIALTNAGGTAEIQCHWDIQGIDVSQQIPEDQPADSYSIDMVATVVAL
ncbi:MAG: hypothetical protein U0517_01530 [Candidatus Andersenbacteria bacterium]